MVTKFLEWKAKNSRFCPPAAYFSVAPVLWVPGVLLLLSAVTLELDPSAERPPPEVPRA
ncbi:hypothetical protein SAMN00790413_00769 [Deinococcus hopiensis KR-140]|uniref:Uncharacterized protein n=1 Tax=Deinococcus hopiensis KR-140 TaxID=695939 RepID=A0A1W1VBS4_9DEIO|nr:hypothetical protein SAMN00790413_00769 [Deinococcus hopiensis KR-140]